MQREIKFRAWDKVTEKMYDITYIDFEDKEVGIINFDDRTRSFDEVVLLQFTGLHDKNGKEIYEGDIFKSGNGRRWEIMYGAWRFWDGKQLCPMWGLHAWGVEKEGETAHAELPLREDMGEHAEIIGNIYENPDLLNV